MSSFNTLNRSLQVRMLLQFITSLSSMMILPYIAVYFSSQIGTSTTGVLVILVIIFGMIGALLSGYLADRIGRKKIMMVAESGVGVSYLLIAAVNSPWLTLPYVSFGLFMINLFCNGMFLPASTAMIHDLVKINERKFVFTTMYWLSNLATAIGTMIGGFFFVDYPFYFFILIAVISFLSTVITYKFIQESLAIPSENNTDESNVSIWSQYRDVFKEHTYMLYLLACLFIFSLENHLTNYIAIHLKESMMENSFWGITINGINMIGILHAENTIIVVLLVAVVSWMMRRMTDNKQYFLGMFIFVISYTILSFITNPVLLIVMMFFISIGELMYVPVNQSLLADLVNEKQRSSYLAVYGFIGQGQMILAGFAITISSIFSPFTMSTIFLFLGVTGVVLMGVVVKSKSKLYTATKEMTTIS